ncbi:TDP2 [Cervus elaphus hippelaphus]|uniref:TDP2 n=1 Tax=Cervus elaphus hippelaphus TaxID=46360 RepID=A0A212D4F6_CEREH|nr:TDP2 [Cervus elaphus hippelaphus]
MKRNSGPEAGPEAELEEGEPEVKKRRLLCVEFASVASCDAAVAQCYLAENDWEMERALNSYFEPNVEESASESRPESPSEPESWWVTTGRGSGGGSPVPDCVGHPGPAIELGGGSAQRRALGLSSRRRRVGVDVTCPSSGAHVSPEKSRLCHLGCTLESEGEISEM